MDCSLLEANKYELKIAQIEDSFSSNTCRCTGFRPILDAFKSFAKDSPRPKLIDIEELNTCKKKDDCELKCDSTWCLLAKESIRADVRRINLKDGRVWYRVYEIQEIFDVLNKEGKNSYMLVNGNTGRGEKYNSFKLES